MIFPFIFDLLKEKEVDHHALDASPSTSLPSIVVVISPLKSLMLDQVQSCKDKGIKAVCIFAAPDLLHEYPLALLVALDLLHECLLPILVALDLLHDYLLALLPCHLLQYWKFVYLNLEPNQETQN